MLGSCQEKTPGSTPLTAVQISVDTTLSAMETIDNIIEPYRRQLNQTLDTPLSYAPENITKTEGQWNTPLGNLMADLMRERASAVMHRRGIPAVDMALHNFGGMRASISKGPVTERNAFEVMPFENKLVVLAIKGSGVNKMVEFLVGASRPHAISGIEIALQSNGNLKHAYVRGEPIKDNDTYYIATSDYLVRGGDGMGFFSEQDTVYDTGYKIRNAMVDYFKANDTLRAQIDNRFVQLNQL